MGPSLIVIPSYLRDERDLHLLDRCLWSIKETVHEDDAAVLVVDDGSPARDLVEQAQGHMIASWFDFEFIAKEENEGFSRAVNVGLRRALEEGRDAVLCNADIEFEWPWLWELERTQKLHSEGLADVAGALLMYPNGTIQHAGVYFSFLTRQFDHLHKHGPMNLPEAHVPRACPVTAALHLIRHETLTRVGLYDEEFRMGYEDVDYCLRVFLDGGECVYNPLVRAWHQESVFRGRDPSPRLQQWQWESFVRLAEKYAHVNFANLVPAL